MVYVATLFAGSDAAVCVLTVTSPEAVFAGPGSCAPATAPAAAI
jgi:hypothetical protein